MVQRVSAVKNPNPKALALIYPNHNSLLKKLCLQWCTGQIKICAMRTRAGFSSLQTLAMVFTDKTSFSDTIKPKNLQSHD